MKKTTAVFASLLGATSLWAAAPASAQGILFPGTPEKGVWVEAAHPSMELFDLSATSSVWFVSGRLPVGEKLSVTADLPFAYAKLSGGELRELFGTESNRVLGNPLVGVEYRAFPALTLELSTRVPLTTADEESFADVVAAIGEPLRTEAFAQQLVPLSVAASYARAGAGGLGVRARSGVTALFSTADDETEASSETVLDYGVMATYAAGAARLGAGVSGRWMATEEGSFSDRSLHQLGLSADVAVGSVRPGVSFRVPLDEEYRELVSSSLGFYLQVPLR